MKDSRGKGNRFENDVCRELSRWLVDEPTEGWPTVYDLPFRRRTTTVMPLEGHWRGAGDIVARPDVYCPFAIEAKKVEGWSFDGLFNLKWPILGWWTQCVQQAEKVGLIPLLLFSKNRAKIYAVLPPKLVVKLKLSQVGRVLVLERHDGGSLWVTELHTLIQIDRRKLHRAIQRLQS